VYDTSADPGEKAPGEASPRGPCSEGCSTGSNPAVPVRPGAAPEIELGDGAGAQLHALGYVDDAPTSAR